MGSHVTVIAMFIEYLERKVVLRRGADTILYVIYINDLSGDWWALWTPVWTYFLVDWVSATLL